MSETSQHPCDDVCGNFQVHPRRKVCKNCKLPWDCHALSEGDIKRIQETVKSLRGEDPPSDSVYAWIPPQCPEERLEEYFEFFEENEVPKHNSEGFKRRLRTLVKQIPETDVFLSACRFVEPEMSEALKEFTDTLRKNSLHFGFVQVRSDDMPQQCHICLKILEKDELVVLPTKDSSTAYHPACFICFTCQQHLADLINCFYVDGKIYCVRDFTETLKPRCKACDELIFSERFIQAGEDTYHSDHLRCFHCDEPLEKHTYSHEGELHCMKCYEKMHGDMCEKCNKLIHLDTRHIEYKEKFWHTECFTCELCGEAMTEFDDVDDKFYCIKCFNDKIASKCESCKENISNVEKFIKFEGKEFHMDCFKCQDCDKNLGTGTFLTHGGIPYCKECHTQRYAVRCYKCKQPITGGEGLMYNKQPYHEGCFTCYRCQARLGKQVFKKVDDDIYCKSCYLEKFCKKCHSCQQPILLGVDEVMYSYQDIKWHAECFTCRVCQRSLEDTKFLIRDRDLICERCTSQEDTFAATSSKGQKNQHRFSTAGVPENQCKKSSSGSLENQLKGSASGISERHHKRSKTGSKNQTGETTNSGEDTEQKKESASKDLKKKPEKSDNSEEKS